MWAVMTDGASITGYPIIGFTNYGGDARYRVYDADATASGWVDLVDTSVIYNAWTAFSIKLTGTSYQYLINNQVVYTDSTIAGSTGFSAAIMQAYNFYGDPALLGANPVNYTANWANTPVPIPGALWLFAPGLAGLIGLRRRFTK
jgi:hypothetical protein